MSKRIRDKDLRISQTPGAIFELTDDDVLEMRGHLPDKFMKHLQETGAWRFINAVTYGMSRSAWWFRSHTTFRLEYNGGFLQVVVGDSVSHRTQGYKVPENELTLEVVLAELWTMFMQVMGYLRENPSRGHESFYGPAEDKSAEAGD